MGVDETQTNGTQGAGTEGGAGDSTQKPDAKEAGQLAALIAERAKRQAAETKLAAYQAEQAEAARKAEEDAGKHRELYEKLQPEHDALKAKLTAYEERETARVEALTARNAARVEQIPEPLRAIVPTGYDADSLSAWIDGALPKLTSPKFAAGTLGGGGTAGGTQPIPAEAREHAIKHGKVTPEDQQKWFQNVWLKTPGLGLVRPGQK